MEYGLMSNGEDESVSGCANKLVNAMKKQRKETDFSIIEGFINK